MELPKELDPWQVVAVHFIQKWRRVLFADKMGIGKTFPTLVATLTEEENKSILISCGNSALSVWPKEVEKWYPEHLHRLVLVEGQKHKRMKIWNNAVQGKIYLTSLGALRSDIETIPWDWDVIIIDEAHKAKNHKSQLFDAIYKLTAHRMFVMITGTPTSKGLHELFAYLKLAFRKTYTSYWRFINSFFIVDDGMWGKAIAGLDPTKEEAITKLLSTFMLRRMKVDDKEPVKFIPLYVEPSLYQRQLYLKLAKDMLAETSPDQWTVSSTIMGNTIKFRQVLICPKVLDPCIEDYGAGIEAICQHIDDAELSHTVIFCPFPSAFDHLSAYIEQRLKVTPYVLRGGMDSQDVDAAIRSWESEDKGVMLLSIKFAQSFDLTRAHTGYFLGYEWDPNDNDQAVYRIHRRSSPKAGTIYYVTHGNNYIDADQRMVLAEKNGNNHVINNVIPNMQKLLHEAGVLK